MTLIIGIKCKDGIVMASDGAATWGSMGQSTAQQPTKKLNVLRDKIVIGVSGPVGLGQLLTGGMETMWDKGDLSGKRPYEAMALISKMFREYIVPELQVAQVARNAIGNAGLTSAISATLVALPVSKKLCLFQFDQQGAPEQATPELPFVCIGSGQSIADPFLALLKRVFWSDHQPTIGEGLFAAVWTLDHAIKVNAGGVAEPMQVITVSEGEMLKELGAGEMSDHREAVKNAEQTMKDSLLRFKKIVSIGESITEEIPQPG